MAAIAEFHAEHYRQASGLQRAIDRMTDQLGRPAFVIGLVVVVAAWALSALLVGHGGVEQPSFAWLELSATLAALLVAVLILVTQRREDQLAERRAQLTLELAILADQRSAKAIELLEALRRDSPDVADRVDLESEEMGEASDPRAVLAAIDEQDPEAER